MKIWIYYKFSIIDELLCAFEADSSICSTEHKFLVALGSGRWGDSQRVVFRDVRVVQSSM